MCNCVIKCVGFHGLPQFAVTLPVKRFAGDPRAKSPLPSHKKVPARNSTTSLGAATFDFTRSGRLGACELMAEGREDADGKSRSSIFERRQGVQHFTGLGSTQDRVVLANLSIPENQHALSELCDVMLVRDQHDG